MVTTKRYYNKYILPPLTIILIILNLYQCIYALTQLLEIHLSGHPNFAFTGSFYNPGPFGCYLAVIFPLCLRLISNNNKLQNGIGMGMVLSSAILIPASMSRTAIVACAIGGIFATADRWQLKQLPGKRLLIIAAMCLTAGGGIYLIKRDSADGRFLMWKVAAQAAIEAPLSGVGWENVAGSYGEAQERYFASGRGSEKEKLVADAPEYVFNEYLQVAIAYGPLAAGAIIVLIAGGLVTALRNRAYGFAGSTAAVAAVMFASYPLQFPLFTATICLILAGAWLSSTSPLTGWGATAVIATAGVLTIGRGGTADIRTEFSVAHTLHRTRNYRKSNDLLLGILPRTSDPMVLDIIGKNYRALGMADSAEVYFRKAAARCPNRLYPHYLLMQLYGDSSSLDRAGQQREARILLDMKEKIPSPAVEDMRRETKAILITHTTN